MPKIVHNQWQAFRTRKDNRLALTATHSYPEPGEYRVVVKVIDTLGNDTMRAARSYALTLGVTWTGQLHELTGWAALLVEERRRRHVAFAPSFARSLQAKVQRIYLNWREDLRYKPNRPFRGEVAQVLQGAQWLLDQSRYL